MNFRYIIIFTYKKSNPQYTGYTNPAEAIGLAKLWFKKYNGKQVKYVVKDTETNEILLELSSKVCDICGQLFTGESYPVVDENFNTQKGLISCGCNG